MSSIHIAAVCALLAATGHSILSERLFLRPLRADSSNAGAFSGETAKRLATAMFHLASVCWAAMAASMLLMEPLAPGTAATFAIFASVYALSGIGNFWIAGRIHPGGILLLSAAALTLHALQA